MTSIRSIDENDRSSFYGLAALSFLLLGLCAVLAGLTLAICSLDETWLEITSVTARSKRRAQARAVLHFRRHHNWMLCSLIICSVACSEAFPIVMKEMLVNKPPWLIVLLSTLFIAIFGEILPQTIIPRKALAWAYQFRPMIWFCMAITIFLSYPIGWLIDKFGGNIEEHAIFSNSALAILIGFHTKKGGRGGKLRESTARVMIGALELDHCRIGGEFTRIPHASDNEMVIDIEKAEGLTTRGIYTKWSAVHTVDINERVDGSFLKKVMRWNHSRIPVTGDSYPDSGDRNNSTPSGAGKKIFGFLHTKNLIGIDFKDRCDSQASMFVKDLSIYPLPIVRDDMEVIRLLSLFQLGMARMAIVVHAGETATHEEYWETDFLEAALRSTMPHPQRERVFGIRTPRPVGLITYDDIISRLLQKRSCDEKDFFHHGLNNIDPAKLQAMTITVSRYNQEFENKGESNSGTSRWEEEVHSLPRRNYDYHYDDRHGRQEDRRDERRCENNATAVDPAKVGVLGVKTVQSPLSLDYGHISGENHHLGSWGERQEREVGGLDGTRDGAIYKARRRTGESSYTLNDLGGLHGSNSSGTSTGNHLYLSAEDLAELGEYPSPFPRDRRRQAFLGLRTTSMPSNGPMDVHLEMRKTSRGSTSVILAPRLPQFQRVIPFSRHHYSSYERKNLREQENFDFMLPNTSLAIPESLVELPPPKYTTRNNGFEPDNLDQQHKPRKQDTGDCGETLPIVSWDFSDFEDGSAHLGDHGTITRSSTYELATVICEPENIDHHVPQTMPRQDVETTGGNNPGCIPQREESFHDDRALLPSQRKRFPCSTEISGTRSSSLWF